MHRSMARVPDRVPTRKALRLRQRIEQEDNEAQQPQGLRAARILRVIDLDALIHGTSAGSSAEMECTEAAADN